VNVAVGGWVAVGARVAVAVGGWVAVAVGARVAVAVAGWVAVAVGVGVLDELQALNSIPRVAIAAKIT
jgi:hypothetical protein